MRGRKRGPQRRVELPGIAPAVTSRHDRGDTEPSQPLQIVAVAHLSQTSNPDPMAREGGDCASVEVGNLLKVDEGDAGAARASERQQVTEVRAGAYPRDEWMRPQPDCALMPARISSGEKHLDLIHSHPDSPLRPELNSSRGAAGDGSHRDRPRITVRANTLVAGRRARLCQRGGHPALVGRGVWITLEATPDARTRLPSVIDSDRRGFTMAQRFLQLADVCEVLNISSSQAYALVRSGDLPAIRIGGRGQWRVEATELEAFIQRKYSETREHVAAHPYVDGQDDG